jgi:hypothetical protein
MSNPLINPFPEEPQILANDPALEVKKIRYQAWIECEKSKFLAEIEAKKLDFEREKLDFEREKSDIAYYDTVKQKIYESYLEIAKGQIAQANFRAEFIQKASAAITSAYTAILGFSFAFSTKPLPVRGLLPSFFAGLSLVLATAYIAFVTQPVRIRGSVIEPGTEGDLRAKRNTFIEWTRIAAGYNRRKFIQYAVFSLGMSIFFLPSAYINMSDGLAIFFGASVLFVGWWIIFKSKILDSSN